MTRTAEASAVIIRMFGPVNLNGPLATIRCRHYPREAAAIEAAGCGPRQPRQLGPWRRIGRSLTDSDDRDNANACRFVRRLPCPAAANLKQGRPRIRVSEACPGDLNLNWISGGTPGQGRSPARARLSAECPRATAAANVRHLPMPVIQAPTAAEIRPRRLVRGT